MDAPSLHIAMFPWFAMGYLTPYFHLSNKLAKRGHRISFFIPLNSQSKLDHFNHHPHLITLVPLTFPQIEGLPHNSGTTSDLPVSLYPLLMTALDHTEKQIEMHLLNLKPDIVFFNFAYWIPNLARRLGIKSIQYWIVNPVTVAYSTSPARMNQGSGLTEADLMEPPMGLPDSSIFKLEVHEARVFASRRKMEFGNNVLFYDRIYKGLCLADAIGFKGCREVEGPYVGYLEDQFKKPVLLSGPVIPEKHSAGLEQEWANWLGRFNAGSVIYCALGSESILQQNQFQELLLGLELSGMPGWILQNINLSTGMPFLAALKTPIGCDSIEEAFPEGFKERVKGKGVVVGGWVQQQSILAHSSVGCFITHCGTGSLTEALVNQCQMVLLPRLDSDQILNGKLMSRKLKVGVEVEKDQHGSFSRESVCRAVKIVMDDKSEIAEEVRENHAKLRSLLLSNDLESSYVDTFCSKLQDLLT